jgi:hypothetical protein
LKALGRLCPLCAGVRDAVRSPPPLANIRRSLAAPAALARHSTARSHGSVETAENAARRARREMAIEMA